MLLVSLTWDNMSRLPPFDKAYLGDNWNIYLLCLAGELWTDRKLWFFYVGPLGSFCRGSKSSDFYGALSGDDSLDACLISCILSPSLNFYVEVLYSCIRLFGRAGLPVSGETTGLLRSGLVLQFSITTSGVPLLGFLGRRDLVFSALGSASPNT